MVMEGMTVKEGDTVMREAMAVEGRGPETEDVNAPDIWEVTDVLMASNQASLDDLSMRFRVYAQGIARQAVAAERERCAKLAEDRSSPWGTTGSLIASAIRKGEA